MADMQKYYSKFDRKQVQKNLPKFKEVYDPLINEACEVLNTNIFQIVGSSKGNYIERHFYFMLRNLHNPTKQSKILSAECHVGLLVKDLKIIRDKDTEYYENVRDEILNENLKNDNYYGKRFEISIGSCLLSKGYSFLNPEPPDFVVGFENETISIECTSKKPASCNKGYHKYVWDALERKHKKYKGEIWHRDKPSILCVNLSSVIYDMNKETQKPPHDDKFRDEILRKINNTNFDSVILAFYTLNRSTRKFKQSYERIDKTDIDSYAKRFLDKWLSGKEKYTKDNQPYLAKH